MVRGAPDISLGTAWLTAIFSSFVAALYTMAQVEPSSVVSLFITTGPLIAVILWLQKDTQVSGRAVIVDWGLFVWFAWPILIPWYVFKTRGRAGWRLLLQLLTLVGLPYLTGATVAALIYGVRWSFWYLGIGA